MLEILWASMLVRFIAMLLAWSVVIAVFFAVLKMRVHYSDPGTDASDDAVSPIDRKRAS